MHILTAGIAPKVHPPEAKAERVNTFFAFFWQKTSLPTRGTITLCALYYKLRL